MHKTTMMQMKDLSFSYENGEFSVIDEISFDVYKGDFLSLIGPSGCGKSTLLRMMAGLIKPTSGKILYGNKELTQPIKDIAFVFQDFALLPWLTNTENVKLGMSALNISDKAKTKKAMDLLENVGLRGFEDAYPNVLSGGMKQRVGIARAIASDPRVLLMDEPFSSLDELTANTLRNDVLYMLKNKDISVSAVVMVTHNVSEAVELSNKVVVLANKPSYVKEVLDVKLPYPRNHEDKAFMKKADEVYSILTRNE